MASKWFYQVMGSQVGPVSSAELLSLARRGTITHDTLVRKGDNGDWVFAERVKGLPFAAHSADEANEKRESDEQCFESAISEACASMNLSRQTRVTESQAPLVLEGRQGKSLVVHGGTVKIIKKGWVFATQREKVLPIRNITSVEVKKPGPFVVGFIQFSIAGGHARNSSYSVTGGAFDAVQDENSVVFLGDDKYMMALRIKSYVEQYGQSDNQATQVGFSIADEIAKLKRLADEGILSKEEFEAKKKQLLGI